MAMRKSALVDTLRPLPGETLRTARAIPQVCMLLLSPVTVGLISLPYAITNDVGGNKYLIFFRSKKSLVLLVSEQWKRDGMWTMGATDLLRCPWAAWRPLTLRFLSLSALAAEPGCTNLHFHLLI